MNSYGCNLDKNYASDPAACDTKFTTDEQRKQTEINLSKVTHFADQTPTPTRLLRECEELGLFRDVNPFEETFRKACEAAKSGESLLLPKSADNKVPDDTLHTPNVFPLSIEPPNPDPVKTDSPPNKEAEEIPKPPRSYKKKQQVEKNSKAQAFSLLDQNVTFLLPLPPNPASVKVFSPKYFSVLAKNASKGTNNVVPNKVTPKKREVRRDQPQARNELLESNRLAQMRAREKKKHYVSYLERLNKELVEKNENLEQKLASLAAENAALRLGMSTKRNTNGRDAALQTEPESSMLAIPLVQEKIALTPILGDKIASRATFKEHNYLGHGTDLNQEKSQCFYASLESNKTAPETVPSITIAEGFLRKPLKKRSVPPKLTLNFVQEPLM